MRVKHLWLLEQSSAREPSAGHRALAATLSPHGPVPLDVDLKLGALARQAKTDPNARNVLYAAFLPRLDYWVRRAVQSCFRASGDPAVEPADIKQQAFLVFVDLVLAWDESGSLSAHLIAYFRWRLSDAVRRMSDLRQRCSLDGPPSRLIRDGSHAADESIVLLETLAADLPARQGQVLLMRIRDGLPWTEVASRLNVDIRSAQRDWQAVRESLRASFAR